MAVRIIRMKYSEARVDLLKKNLQDYAEKGMPRYFEILVDDFKVVPRTSNVELFDTYENYVDEDTKKIKVLLYTQSATSPNHEKHIFEMKDEPVPVQQSQALSGVEIESKINEKVDEKVNHARERWETELLKKELDETKKKLDDAEEYIETLQTQIEDIKSKKIEIRGATIGEVAGSAFTGIIKNNPKLLSWMPGGEALAGILGKDDESTEHAPQVESEASFRKKTAISEEEQKILAFVKGLGVAFNPEELSEVMLIINSLAKDKTQISAVADLLTNKPKQKEEK